MGIKYDIYDRSFYPAIFHIAEKGGFWIFTIPAGCTVVEAHLISVYIYRNFLLMMMGDYLLTENVQDVHKCKI
ncbi:MAG: hypothetical protein HDR28_01745 [Lachnospiraceae bacterium]|nr:hypothetical protein [Lachnospiraceae bacterium]